MQMPAACKTQTSVCAAREGLARLCRTVPAGQKETSKPSSWYGHGVLQSLQNAPRLGSMLHPAGIPQAGCCTTAARSCWPSHGPHMPHQQQLHPLD